MGADGGGTRDYLGELKDSTGLLYDEITGSRRSGGNLYEQSTQNQRNAIKDSITKNKDLDEEGRAMLLTGFDTMDLPKLEQAYADALNPKNTYTAERRRRQTASATILDTPGIAEQTGKYKVFGAY